MSEARWWRHLRGDPTRFLLDDTEPGVVWRALVDLLGRPLDSPAVLRAREQARARGAAAALLDRQDPLGFWGSPTAYAARWGGTAWHVIALSELGADPEDPRVQRGAQTLLESLQPPSGGFSPGRGKVPSTCFTAELCTALARFGYAHHPRVREAVAWLAARHEGRGGWSCPELAHLVEGGCPVVPVAALRLIAALPAHERPRLAPLGRRAASWLLERGLFLDSEAPRGWFEPCHPNLSRADLLEAVTALALVGWPRDGTIERALVRLLGFQDVLGRWSQQHRAAFGEARGEASRWVTLKALLVVARYGEEPLSIERPLSRPAGMTDNAPDAGGE